MEQNFETCLYNVVDAAKIQKDEPMKKHTTFRIGGPADYFIMPSNEKELAETIRVCREFSIPIYIVGNGSNLLVGDKGFRGAIIQLYKSMGTFQVEGNQITAQAGCSLAQIANAALECSTDRDLVRSRYSGKRLAGAVDDERRCVWRRDEGCTDECQGYDRRGRDHGASGRKTGTRIPYKHYPGEKIYRFGCRDFAYRRQKRRNKSADG